MKDTMTIELPIERRLREIEALPEIREELVEEIAHKSVHRFIQLDGWRNTDPISHLHMPIDEDGDHVSVGERYDLRASPAELAVRVQVHIDADPGDVLRLLRKMVAEYEKANGPDRSPGRQRTV